MEAIVLAGGFGTRLRGVISDVPKPMAPIGTDGTPFLSVILQKLRNEKIDHVILATGYKHEVISQYYGNDFCGMKISYSVENKPLLTGGAIRQAMQYCSNGDIAVFNGDTLFDVVLKDMLVLHQKEHADVTIALKHMTNFDRYGSVEIRENTILGFKEKKYCEDGWINGGVYVINKKHMVNQLNKFSFEKYLEENIQNLNMVGFKSESYFIDIGVPGDYKKAQNEVLKIVKINNR